MKRTPGARRCIRLPVLGLTAFALGCSGDPAEITNVPCRTHERSIEVLVSTNDCPNITEFTVTPSSVIVGSSVQLRADAASPGHDVTFEWTADSGVIADATLPITTFRCTAGGLANVTLTVSNGSCPRSVTYPVSCTCEPDSGYGCDAG